MRLASPVASLVAGYQNECAYEISEAAGGWKKRVYGEQYDKLLAIKMK